MAVEFRWLVRVLPVGSKAEKGICDQLQQVSHVQTLQIKQNMSSECNTKTVYTACQIQEDGSDGMLRCS